LRRFVEAHHQARSGGKKTPQRRAMQRRPRESPPDHGRLRSVPKRSVAPVELHLQQPEYAQTLRLTGAAHYGLANILIGGVARNHGKWRGSIIKPYPCWERYGKGNRRVTFWRLGLCLVAFAAERPVSSSVEDRSNGEVWH